MHQQLLANRQRARLSSSVLTASVFPSPIFDSRTGSRLEGLLEKSHVAHMFGNKANKRRRTNLDAALLDDEKASAPAAAAADEPEQAAPTMSMATQITSYNPCKDDPYGASSMPIYQVSTFAQPSATTFGEYDYSRSGNPTRAALEKQICELEGGHRGFAFSSGMAALSAVTRLVKPGQEIILNDDSYGGTYRLLSKVAARNNVLVRYVDMSGSAGPANLSAAISGNTKLIMLESPTNPMQRILDIRAISRIAHAHGAVVEVDSTMMSPCLQQPITLGADIVVHSATKFISGHADCMAGVVVVKDKALAEQVYFYQNAEGTGLSPFDSWLLLRGVKTMHIRVERQQENALLVATFLQSHPRVTHVYYTGLESHDGHALHMSQASGGGSVVCFRTGSLEMSQHIVTHTKLFKITVSFGSVNSLISLPGAMSHASIPAEVRAAREFPEDLIRISIGIESAVDLIADLRKAMSTYTGAGVTAANTKTAAAGGSSGATDESNAKA
jgi:cysteine-S-conjugate beta-lyase